MVHDSRGINDCTPVTPLRRDFQAAHGKTFAITFRAMRLRRPAKNWLPANPFLSITRCNKVESSQAVAKLNTFLSWPSGRLAHLVLSRRATLDASSLAPSP